jgi:serine/threonine protein kinase
MISGNVPFHAKATTDTATDIIARIRLAEFSFKDSVWDGVSDLAKDLITGLLTVDPTKRLTLKDISHHKWLRAAFDSSQAHELQTPTILPSSADDIFNDTFNAFLTANRDGFQLMDVDTAPLLVKRRGQKRRSEVDKVPCTGSGMNSAGTGSGNRKVSAAYDSTKLAPVYEGSERDSTSRPGSSMSGGNGGGGGGRPTTLNIEKMDEQPNKLFFEYRDNLPPYLKYSRDVEPDSDLAKQRNNSQGSDASTSSQVSEPQ